MNDDDILKVARECGLPREVVTYRFDQIITFARRIAAMQREIDAGVCDVRYMDYMEPEMKEVAAAIREQE